MIRALAALAMLPLLGSTAPHDPLAGRVPVGTEACVTIFGNDALTVLDERTLLYRPIGRRLFRNDLPEPCPGLDVNDLLVIEPFAGSQYCENDRFRAIDRGVSLPGGVCRLGKFTAFERPR